MAKKRPAESLMSGRRTFKPCTEFARAVTIGMPKHMGLTLEDKLKAGERHGFKPSGSWRPKRGQTLITDEKTAYGHVVVVNKVSGRRLRLSESNYARHNAVTHNRSIDRGSPKIRYVLPTEVKE